MPVAVNEDADVELRVPVFVPVRVDTEDTVEAALTVPDAEEVGVELKVGFAVRDPVPDRVARDVIVDVAVAVARFDVVPSGHTP